MEDIRDFSIREGEPETRVQDRERAEVMAEAGDYQRKKASSSREHAKNNEQRKNNSDHEGDIVIYDRVINEDLKRAEDADISAEMDEENASIALQKIRLHPELASIEVPDVPFAKSFGLSEKIGKIDEPKKLVKLERYIKYFDKILDSANEMIDRIDQNPLSIWAVPTDMDMYNRSEYSHDSRYSIINCIARDYKNVDLHDAKIEELRKNNNATVADFKQAQIDFIKQYSTPIENFVKSGKELLVGFDS